MSIGTRERIASSSSLLTWRDHLANAQHHLDDVYSQRMPRSCDHIETSLTSDSTTTSNNNTSAKSFCIGIDYGTTFTSISYSAMSRVNEDTPLPQASDIKTIRNWPGEATGNADQVPTEIWYPAVPLRRHRPYEQFDLPPDFNHEGITVQVDEEDGGESNAERSNSTTELQNDCTAVCSDDSTEFLWGYPVSYHRYHLNTPRNPRTLVQRPKLMMINTEYTKEDRRQLCQQVQYLVKNKIIRKYGKRKAPDVRDVRDIITDFLVKVFEHTKEQLQIYENFSDDCPVEFVLAVPTIWSSQASRILQLSVEAAIRASSFGKLVNNSLMNVFIVPEPEGGVTWMLQSMPETPLREVITCLDCGGGTVDAATYEVGDSYPLRLGSEILDATGDNCGGSYLNDNFKTHLRSRLRFEKYLECNDNTIDSIINRVAREFEAIDKPRVDILRKPFFRYRIDHLKAAGSKRFENNILRMELQDYEEIYLPILGRVWAVLKKQLEAAREQGLRIKKVILIGGFAASPALVSVLKAQIFSHGEDCNLPYEIELIEHKRRSVAAVSAGAVLRALDKANGPRRLIQSSYGFLRREPHDPRTYKGHKYACSYKDLDNDEQYVDVINYFLRKGDILPPAHEFEPIKMMHSFPVDDEDPDPDAPPRLSECVELLYVSDTATQSHFPFKGFKNRDAQLVGRIVTDVTVLKNRNLLEIVEPRTESDGKVHGRRHCIVEYDLVPMIKGRDLIYEARWPSSDASATVESDRKRRRFEKYEFTRTAQISIAAAFMPGTS